MIKKTITYVDFNGKERTEDFYFHLSLPEATRLVAELGAVGTDDLSKVIEKIAEQQDFKKLIDIFDKIILSSYGQKSVDGKSFIKTDEARELFANSNAYAELFEEIVNDPEGSKTFFEGIGTNVAKVSAPNIQPLTR